MFCGARRLGRHVVTSATLAATTLVSGAAWAEIERATGLGKPRDISSEGWRIDWLVDITLVFIILLFAAMVGWMLISCVFHDKAHEAEYSHGTSRGSIAAKLIVAGLIFMGVDGNLFINSTLDVGGVLWNFEEVNARSDALRVEVNARQWAWEFRLAGDDGAFGTGDDIVTFNDLVVPVGRPIVMQMGAPDVLHSLYLPNLRVKQDIVPGMITWAWFQAQDTGEYAVACAQHCGTSHYKMAARVTVLPQPEFEGWFASAAANAARKADPADLDGNWGWPWQEATR